MNNQYPLKPILDHASQYGRFGDSQLVHLNPMEINMLRRMSPTGELTINPVTGQQEAFLPFVAPLLGMAGGALGLSGIATAALTGVGTAAITGDLKRGIVSGLTAGLGAGLGSEVVDMFGSAGEAAQVASEASNLASDAEAVADLATVGASVADVSPLTMSEPTPFLESANTALNSWEAANLPDIGATTTLYGMGTGSAILAGMDAQDELEDDFNAQRRDAAQDEQEYYDMLQLGYAAAQPGTAPGLSGARARMSNVLPAPYVPGMAEGGVTSSATKRMGYPVTDEEALVLQRAGTNNPLGAHDQNTLENYYIKDQKAVRKALQDSAKANAGRPGSSQSVYEDLPAETKAYLIEQGLVDNGVYTGFDPVSIQAGLRGAHSVAPPKDYMVGFEPEFNYFQNDPNNVLIPSRTFRPTQDGIQSDGEYFDPILDRDEYMKKLADYYTLLGSYTPENPESPEESPSIPDDPDNVGDPGGPTIEDPGPMDPTIPEGGDGSGSGDGSDGSDLGYIWQRGVYGSHNPVPGPEAIASSMTANGASEDFETALRDVKNGKVPFVRKGELAQAPNGRVFRTTKDLTYSEAIDLGLYRDSYSTEIGLLDFSGEDQLMGGMVASPDYTGPEAAWRDMFGDEDRAWGDMSDAERIAHSLNYGTGWADDAVAGEYVGSDGGLTQEEIDEGRNIYAELQSDRRGFAEGGKVPFPTSAPVNAEISAGGIADVAMPQPDEIEMVAAALMGEIDQPDAVIEMFVRRYGPELFARVREMILRQAAPDAQTEGMIEGEGSGMDDMVPGMIGSSQPVAVSPGEYIVPADVVSGLGDGSSDAGARQLDGMLERVRMARGGTTHQAPPVDPRRVMPV